MAAVASVYVCDFPAGFSKHSSFRRMEKNGVLRREAGAGKWVKNRFFTAETIYSYLKGQGTFDGRIFFPFMKSMESLKAMRV